MIDLGWLFLVTVLAVAAPLAAGHGRLMDPPSRSSAWRMGFDTPPNYNDNELSCGGFTHQWFVHGGKCGICGDPYDGKRENEAGGKYATGTITRAYSKGDAIDITVEITSNHKGWSEFRICPNNDIHKPVTQECLDQYLLPLVDGSGTRVTITSDMHFVTSRLQLPKHLTCTQCVVQWKYNTGNRWDTDPVTGESGAGLGPQEQFYGCADVAIRDDSEPGLTPPQVSTPTSPSVPSSTIRSTARLTELPSSTPGTGEDMECRAVGDWEGNADMDSWCRENCTKGNCAPSHCFCENSQTVID